MPTKIWIDPTERSDNLNPNIKYRRYVVADEQPSADFHRQWNLASNIELSLLPDRRQARRDRFIAAALTGFISACDDFDARHFDDSVCARSSIEMADAVLSLLDSESSETSETFERESEGKL